MGIWGKGFEILFVLTLTKHFVWRIEFDMNFESNGKKHEEMINDKL